MRSRTLKGSFRQKAGSLKLLNASSACMHLHLTGGYELLLYRAHAGCAEGTKGLFLMAEWPAWG